MSLSIVPTDARGSEDLTALRVLERVKRRALSDLAPIGRPSLVATRIRADRPKKAEICYVPAAENGIGRWELRFGDETTVLEADGIVPRRNASDAELRRVFRAWCRGHGVSFRDVALSIRRPKATDSAVKVVRRLSPSASLTLFFRGNALVQVVPAATAVTWIPGDCEGALAAHLELFGTLLRRATGEKEPEA